MVAALVVAFVHSPERGEIAAVISRRFGVCIRSQLIADVVEKSFVVPASAQPLEDYRTVQANCGISAGCFVPPWRVQRTPLPACEPVDVSQTGINSTKLCRDFGGDAQPKRHGRYTSRF